MEAGLSISFNINKTWCCAKMATKKALPAENALPAEETLPAGEALPTTLIPSEEEAEREDGSVSLPELHMLVCVSH